MEILIELKNIVIKMKNSLNGFNSRMEMREERVIKLEDRTIEILSNSKNGGKHWKKCTVSQGPIDQNNRMPHAHVVRVPEEQDKSALYYILSHMYVCRQRLYL